MKVFHHISALISASFLLLISPLDTMQGTYVNGSLWFELSTEGGIELFDIPPTFQHNSEEYLDNDTNNGSTRATCHNFYPFSFKYFLQAQNRRIKESVQLRQRIAVQSAILHLFQTIKSVYSNTGIPDHLV